METSFFHLNLAAHSRSRGHSAAAKVAYVTAERIADPWTGKVHNYCRRQGVLQKKAINFAGSPSELARLMDSAEKRRNSTVCREVIAALPHGLPLDQRWRLAQSLGKGSKGSWVDS
jgi:hypothetical protein